MITHRSRASRGFTLIETMVAIVILTLAVAGPLVSASRALVAAEIARDRLTASYLAQEGVEYVRAMRDNEFLNAYRTGTTNANQDGTFPAWTSFVSSGDTESIAGCKSTTCTLDPARTAGTGPSLALSPCTGSSCSPLYLANGLYTEQSDLVGAVKTPFTRTVRAYDVSAADERIVSVVTWSFHGQTYTVTVTDHLTPWQ